MKRTKIGQGYFQSGYGRGFKKAPIIWLINGKAYAKDTEGSTTDYTPLTGELEGYVRVNFVAGSFHQTSDLNTDGFRHENYAPATEEADAEAQEEEKVEGSSKMNLTNEQLDLLIKITNYAFDFSGGVPGEYEKWHKIAEEIAFKEFNTCKYDAETVDKRTLELGELEPEPDCDADLDAYSRRFDCEV